MQYGQYGLNLTKSIKAIARNPQPMITEKGKCVPALYVSEKLEAAIQWLVDRYNDGTLKVEGYNPYDTASRTMILTQKKRREEILDVQGYMQMSDFVRESGFSQSKVKRIAKQAGAFCADGKGTTSSVHINVNRFFYYLDTLAAQQEYETFVGTQEAAMLTGLTQAEVIEKIRSGEFKTAPQQNRSYRIYRTSLYRDPTMIPKPMAIAKGVKKYGKEFDSGE